MRYEKNMKWCLLLRLDICSFFPVNLRSLFVYGVVNLRCLYRYADFFFFFLSALAVFVCQKIWNNKRKYGIKLFGHHYSDAKLRLLHVSRSVCFITEHMVVWQVSDGLDVDAPKTFTYIRYYVKTKKENKIHPQLQMLITW